MMIHKVGIKGFIGERLKKMENQRPQLEVIDTEIFMTPTRNEKKSRLPSLRYRSIPLGFQI